jgi:hypothetical protein
MGDLPFDNAGRWVALPVESASCAARMENVRAHRGAWSTCGDYDPELASEQFESESIVELL